MTRKALLIGAQTNGLTGVLPDVEAMARALEPRGFAVQRLVTPDATRAGILDAYEKLIAGAGPDDAFVVYYSGHGGRLEAPGGRDLQFIVPDDYAESGDDDFRGITDAELSVLLARLADQAPNVTVVLDCCHAAHMSRQPPGRRVKALRRAPGRWEPTYESIERHVGTLVAGGLPIDRRALVGHPHAVRVVACAPSESAWEGTNRDGVEMGLLTDALSRALRETEGLRVNWSTLMDAVRREVQTFVPTQRPEVEGPSGRQPFETSELEPLDTLPVTPDGPDQVHLLGAPLLGVEVGDEFAIMPADATGPGDGPAICTAVVGSLLPTVAVARLLPADAEQSIPADAEQPVPAHAEQPVPADARAHRIRAAAPTLPVRLPGDHPVSAELLAAIAPRPMLRPAGPDTHTTVEVAVDGQGRLVVRDETGPLHTPYPATAAGVRPIVANLQRIAQATALRRLGGDPLRPLTHSVRTEWGRVRDGREEPLPLSGGLLFAYAGERVYFRLTNEDEHRSMFVSLIDIGISSRITVLTHADPGGVRLVPGGSYTYGWNEDRQRLTGVEMTWPEGLDTADPRPETVLVLISDAPVDVSVLRQQGARDGDLHTGGGRTGTSTDTGTGFRSGSGSGLERLLGQIATGGSREVGDAPGTQVRYAVQPIDFMVSPTPPPTAERATFLVDDRPAQPVRLLSPRGATPARVAVRIAELVVHANRALGSADIRVDAVVLTGGGAGGQPVYRAETMRFSNVRDNERLPLDNVLIYHGPAVDFLDIAVWVSRDITGSLALSALLEQGLTNPAVQAAGAQVAGLALAAPQAAAAVAVLSAGAVLVNTAYELLTGVVGPNIGLYRTSLLAQEQFGIGRHQRRPQDFSFTFSIEELA